MALLYLPMVSWVLGEPEQGDYNPMTVELADILYVNTYVRPDVIRLTGGDIITPDDSLRGTFWLVQHFDFDIELQEDILQQFESRYQRLETYDFEGVRYFHYQAAEP